MTVIESVRVKKFPHHLFAISPIILGVDGSYKVYLGRKQKNQTYNATAAFV